MDVGIGIFIDGNTRGGYLGSPRNNQATSHLQPRRQMTSLQDQITKIIPAYMLLVYLGSL